jgi:SAM-dependent methyltransferase
MPDAGQEPKERWSSGAAYEAYVGRWSRAVAREFVGWVEAPSDRLWVDVGCGTGALTQAILAQAHPAAVIGVDRSIAFVAYTETAAEDPRASFLVGDGVALPLADGACAAAVSGLVLNFVPEPAQMVAEMARVTREGGTVALYVWDYAGEMQMMRHFWDAAAELDPAARELDEGPRFPICNADQLHALFEAAGLSGVHSTAIDVDTHFQSFDDYWSPFLGGTGPAPTYVSSLSESRRDTLREHLRARLPVDSDGGFHLIARANAVRGIRQ